jgi:hypothetical protein
LIVFDHKEASTTFLHHVAARHHASGFARRHGNVERRQPRLLLDASRRRQSIATHLMSTEHQQEIENKERAGEARRFTL